MARTIDNPKIGVVVPFYKRELFSKFLLKWGDFGEGITLYAVEDNPKKSFKDKELPKGTKYYCWKDIDKDLRKDAWIISRRSSAIRSYGYMKAYQDGMDYVLTLDDDCYPAEGSETIERLIENHLFVLTTEGQYSSYFNVGEFLFPGERLWMRGSPVRYRKPRKAVVSVGGWNNNPDLDAWTQLENQHPKLRVEKKARNVPKYLGVTMCGMNVMFKREVIPIAYFLLQGERWGVDRVDDIWAGLLMKKVLDKFDMPMAINGFATIRHERASDAFTSLKKEGITLLETELLWDRLMTLQLRGDTLQGAYLDLTEQVEPTWFGTEDYGTKLKAAMRAWNRLL